MKKIHKAIIQKQASAIKRAIAYIYRKRQEPDRRDSMGNYIPKIREPKPEFIQIQNRFWLKNRAQAKHANAHYLARMFRAAYNNDRDLMDGGSYYPGDDVAYMMHRGSGMVRYPGHRILDIISGASTKDAMAIAVLGKKPMTEIVAARETFDRERYQKFPDLDNLPEDAVVMAVPADRDYITKALEEK